MEIIKINTKYSCEPLGLRLLTNEIYPQTYITEVYSPLFTNRVQKIFYINIGLVDKNELLKLPSFVSNQYLCSYISSFFFLRVLTTDISC